MNNIGVKKSVVKILKIVAGLINSGGTPTLISISDHVYKQCTVRGADATMLARHIRSACQRAVKNGFMQADGKVFSLTGAGMELLNSCQNGTSASINLILDKLLAEKVNELVI